MKKNCVKPLAGLGVLLVGLILCLPFTGCSDGGGGTSTKSYTVTFNGNDNTGGTAPKAIKTTTGASITLPEKGTLVKTGSAFAGWNVKPDGTGTNYNAGDSYTVTASVTLYAKWVAPGTEFTVTFNGNGNTGGTAPTAIEAAVDTGITLPAAGTLVKTGSTFAGWNVKPDGTGTNYNVGDSYTVTGNVILHAKWVASDTEFTVTFNGNDSTGGTVPTAIKRTVGTVIELPGHGTLVKTGNTFAGWNVKPDGTGTNYNAGDSYTVNGNVTLHAKWVSATTEFTVTFNGNGSTGGSAPAQIEATVGTSITLPAAGTLVKTGYTFGGWNTNDTGTGTNYAAGASYTVNGTVILYAKWTASGSLSGNANIRAVTASTETVSDPAAQYGLYIGGMPATSNGTPSATDITGTGITNGIIGGNTASLAQGSPIVVIVEDAKVTKVEFGRNGATNDDTEPTWQELNKTNDANTPSSLTNLRYVGTLAEANATPNYRFWVRITAEDGSTLIYRYYVKASNVTDYSTVTALTIGGVNVITAGTLGTPAGWWNTTVAPTLAAGSVTLQSGTNVAVAATWRVGSQANASTFHYAVLPASTPLPLLEGADVTFTTGNPTSIPTIEDGGYILLRAQYNSNLTPVLGHYLIKVNVRVDAQTPVISEHPHSADYVIGAVPTALSVTANVTDGGSLSYQWWKSAVSGTDAGTAISGQTEATLPASAISTAEGTTWYWVVVTNTNNNASGEKTISISSNKAVVVFSTTVVTRYTVTFNTDGGNAIEEIRVIAGQSMGIDYPANPAKTGYTFSGWYETSDTTFTNPYTAETIINKDTNLKVRWISANANIRAPSVSATGTTAPTTTYGLYIGGNPAVSNGTAATDWNGAGIASGIIAGNANLTYRLGNPVVVIVEDAAVSKVEFGQVFSNSTTTEPTTWQILTKTNDGSTAAAGKRWVGKLDETTQWTTAGANIYVCYVRITAEDGTTIKAYRYGVTVGNAVGSTQGYATLATLTIGGANVITAGADAAPNTGGTPSGWWNGTAAPNLTAGSVTLPIGVSLTDLKVNASWIMGGSGKTYGYAVLPASTVLPLKEGTEITFSTPGGGQTAAGGTAPGPNTYPLNEITISSIEDGGYILLRAQYVSNNYPIVGHYLIKVNAAPSVPSLFKLEYFWVDAHDNLITTSGGNTTIAPNGTVVIQAQPSALALYSVVEWRLDGEVVPTTSSDLTNNGQIYTFTGSKGYGKHNVTLFASKEGKVYSTTIAITVQ